MIQALASPMHFFPGTGPAAEAAGVGFRFGAKGTHTSRTMMFDELEQLLTVVASSAKRDDYAIAIIEANCLSKPTTSTRRLTNQRLGELYGLDPAIPVFRVLRRLWDVDLVGRRLLALLASIARDPLLAATAGAVTDLPVDAELQRATFRTVLQEKTGNRLNDSTLDKVCRNAASTWNQSGHLEGRTFKKRRIVQATPAAAAFAIFVAHAAGFRGAEIFSSAWFKVIDCDLSRARQLALDSKRLGLLDLRLAGDVVELNLARLDPPSERLRHGAH
ncbi:MAG: hypothetical protein C0484_02565 [Rhodospirillum sp.]|nr:hypothetical protein [Rhodospirillum sp.]